MAQRAPKQWTLSKRETITSYECWRQNLQYTLSLDANFAPFLVDQATWGKKTNAAYLINGKTLHSLLYLSVGTSKFYAIAWGETEGHAGYIQQRLHTLHRWEEHGRSENIHHDQQTPPGGTPTLQGQAIWKSRWSYWGTSSSCHQSVIIRYSRQMPSIPADTTYTSFLTRPSPSPNLYDSKEQTKQTSWHNWRDWVTVCSRKRTGGAGGVETSTCCPLQRRQSSWAMPSWRVLWKKIW